MCVLLHSRSPYLPSVREMRAAAVAQCFSPRFRNPRQLARELHRCLFHGCIAPHPAMLREHGESGGEPRAASCAAYLKEINTHARGLPRNEEKIGG
jgi:hypothetical protein